MIKKPVLYRKRIIPQELTNLKNDEILFFDNNKIITKWQTLKPRADFARGCSCYFLDKGFKVSKFMDSQNNCIYYYCDIIETEYHKQPEHTYIFHDLLVDVIVYPNGFVKVMDLAEIPEALDKNLLDIKLAKKALQRTDSLLQIIYGGQFELLTKELGE